MQLINSVSAEILTEYDIKKLNEENKKTHGQLNHEIERKGKILVIGKQFDENIYLHYVRAKTGKKQKGRLLVIP